MVNDAKVGGKPPAKRRRAPRGSIEPDQPQPVWSEQGDVEEKGLPKVGRVLRSLRQRHEMSLKDVADRSGLSVSFLSAIERGQSDISLGRLNRLAEVFGHDIGSLLGYTAQRSTPQFLQDRDRVGGD